MWQLKPVCPQIEASRRASKRALALAKQAKYCVYAIVDPAHPDPRFKGGRPIYVGRTDKLYARIGNHISAGKTANPNSAGIAAALRRILDSGLTPVFEHIGSCDDYAMSYQWEAEWIERLLARGCVLENRCKLPAVDGAASDWRP